MAFVVQVLENYRGEPATHAVIKQIIRVLPEEPLLSGLYVCLGSTGVVGGDYGLVEARRQKKLAMEAWLNDADAKVRAFAKSYIRDLEQQIASEQRRADESRAMRKLDYGEDIEP
jgi:ATP-dependent exoDNAse (exonuclease V) beta subunit